MHVRLSRRAAPRTRVARPQTWSADLYRRKLGLILIFDRERVLDVLAVRLTRVAGQCSLPLITPPSVLVNSAAAVKHAHKPKLVFLSGYPVNRWPHKTNRIDVI